jgi:hypothetical protein
MRVGLGLVAALLAAGCGARPLLPDDGDGDDGGGAVVAADAGARARDAGGGADAAVARDAGAAPPADAAPAGPVACGRVGDPPEEPAAWLQWAFAAHWRGWATTPFGWSCGEYQVDLDFAPDGHYSAHVLPPAPDGCTAFYYGDDEDSPLKVYELTDLATVTGDGRGWIDIFWGGGYTTRGTLDRVRVSDDLTALELEFWATWAGDYGPVSYRLSCTVES